MELCFSTKAVAVGDGEITVETADGQSTVKADTVIYAVGTKSLSEEADALAFCAPEFHEIGDCVKSDNIIAATRKAYAIARGIGRL